MNRRDILLAAAVPVVKITPVKKTAVFYIVDLPCKCVRKAIQQETLDKNGDKLIITTVDTRLGAIVHKSGAGLPADENIAMLDKLINVDIFPTEVTVEPNSEYNLRSPNKQTFVIRDYNKVMSPKELIDISNVLLRTHGVELN